MTRVRRKGGGFFGKLIALLLGFILGIVSTIGGIGGLGYVLVSQVKIKDAIGTVEQFTGELDYSAYITEEYAEKTLLELFGTVAEVSEEFANGTGSLSSLEKISPFVRTAAEGLASSLTAYGVEVNVDGLMETAMSDFPVFLSKTLSAIEVGALIGALGSVNTGDEIMMTLLYGTKGVHYTVVEEGVEMLPVIFTLKEDGKFYDDTDVPFEKSGDVWVKDALTIAASDGEYAYVVTETVEGTSETVYELKLKAGETNVYEAYLAGELQTHSGLTLGDLMGGQMDILSIVGTLSLGQLLNLNGNSDPMLLSLAYGERGKDYEVVADSDGDGYPDVQMLGESKPMTLNDLTGNTDALFQRLALGDVMGLKQGDDSILMSLAYGPTDHYSFDTNGFVQMKPVRYSLNGDKAYDGEKEIGAVVAVTTVGADGVYALTVDEKTVYLRGNDTDGYYTYETQALAEGGAEADRIPYPKTTIADLQNNASDIIGEMELGSALGVDILTATADEKFMVAIAYGYENTHYEIKNKNTPDAYVEWIAPYKPRTINYLRNYSSTVFNEVRLHSLISAKPEDKLFMFLLYGKEGVQYETETVGSETTVNMLQMQLGVAENGDGTFSVYDIFGYDQHATVMATAQGYGVKIGEFEYALPFASPVLNTDNTQKTVTTADGKTANLYYVYTTDGAKAVNYHPRTLAEVYVDDHSVVDDMMKSLTIGELVHYTSDSSDKHSLFNTISTWTVVDLQNKDKIQALTVGDILEIEAGDTILTALKDTPISGLNDAIHTLPLKKIIAESTLDSNMFLKHLKESSIDTLATDIEGLKIADIFATEIAAGGIWKYIDLEDGSGNAYTLKDMNAMMGSVTTNIKNETVGKLAADGIIAVDANFLTEDIIYSITIMGHTKQVVANDAFGGKDTISEMTIQELSTYLVSLFKVVNDFQNGSI